MKKILILGSTSRIANFFIEKLEPTSEIFKISSNKGLDDVYNYNNIVKIIENYKPNVIINFSNVINNDYEKSYRVNTLIAKELFDALLYLEYFPRVVLIGTAAEYGIQEKYSENVITKPCNIYGLTNSMQNQIFNYYTHNYSKINSIYIRPFNIFYEKFDVENLFIGKLNNQLKKILKKNIETLEFGNLNVNRDYLLIDDVYDAIMHLIDFGKNGETYNIGMGASINLKDVISKIFKCLNISSKLKVDYSIKSAGGITINVVADITKIKQIGWQPKYNYDEMIEIYCQRLKEDIQNNWS